MDRRKFLELSLLASGTVFGASASFAGSGPSATLRLTLRPDKPGNAIAADFTGLSYETSQLSDPTFFSPANAALAGFHKRLGAAGILRVGGNTSEYGVWTPEAPDTAAKGDEELAANVIPDALGPDTGTAPAKRRPVTPLAVRNLRGFIDLTGWRLIYGLNMGSESPEAVADEAEYVAKTMGDKLVAFQLCNEPDLFYRNGLRGKDYDYKKFAVEWRRFFRAVRKRVPKAPFAGPDTAFNNEWLVPFAREFKHDVDFLSQHYYAEGPPTDPTMTIERLLSPNPKLEDEFKGMAETQKDTGLPFRMTETNSCYQGGKPGVSDTFASALWGADLMYQLAQAGGTGINFHGGGYGWYTPVAGTPRNGFLARPIYYGMLLFAEAGAGTLVDATLDNAADASLLTAYGIKTGDGTLKAAVFNKNLDRKVMLTIDAGGAASATVMRLIAPRADDTTDTTLGGAVVGGDGAWSAAVTENLAAQNGVFTLHLPRASGALVTFRA
ncbi:MAG: hypothetical protein KGL97_10180 [Alphaproteobacteria bacterium]|nr:hypothetical protein [Alphaproteobacteria bacterium]